MQNRLFRILFYLLQNEKTTAKQLSEELEVSVRTIYRDIDALSEAGIPVYTTYGRNGGIHLMDEFILDKSLLTEEEQKQILMGLQSLESLQNINHSPLLEKLKTFFQKNEIDWIEVDLSRWGSDNNQEQTQFELLKNAVINRQVIEFDYFNSYGGKSRREAEPLKLMFKDRAWYMSAFCRKHQQVRLFRFTRMVQVVLLDSFFEPRHDQPCLFGNEAPYIGNLVQLKLLFPSHVAYRVYDQIYPNEVQWLDDDTLCVEMKIPEDTWLYGFLLSFGEDVTVAAPDHVRFNLAQRWESIWKKHCSASPNKE